MKNTITYKSFIGSLQFSQSDKTFFGKIEGVNDLVTFEGKSVDELIKAFHDAVDDYLYICKLKKKEPHKSFKGSFNVRVNPEIHARAYHSAKSLNLSLNQFVRESIEKNLSEGLKNKVGLLRSEGVKKISGFPNRDKPRKFGNQRKKSKKENVNIIKYEKR